MSAPRLARPFSGAHLFAAWVAVGSLVLPAATSAGPPSNAPLGRVAPPWLGVAMSQPKEGARSPGGGVLVTHVVRGSPASRGGIAEGDVLMNVGGVAVRTPVEVTRAVSSHVLGDALAVTLMHAGESRTLSVTLAARPTGDEMLRMDHLGAAAPPWSHVEMLGSAPASLAELRGHVVLLDFWASWCSACRLVSPTLNGLSARYGAQGLRVVGLTNEGAEDTALFVERAGLKYAIGVDAEGATGSAYGVSVLPTLFVIDKRGVVRDVSTGYDPGHLREVDRLVAGLLAEPAPPP